MTQLEDPTATTAFFEHPILNSPYERPSRHWELDEMGQPTQRIVEARRRADFVTPIPKPKRRKRAAEQQVLIPDDGEGISTRAQQYERPRSSTKCGRS